MPLEPQLKRTIAFFDGQNLFHAAREAYGYTYPNYNPVALAGRICRELAGSGKSGRCDSGNSGRLPEGGSE
jgi:hypothetical protein